MSEKTPQPWDTMKASEAFADEHALVLALSDDSAIQSYQRELQLLTERRLETAADMDDFTNRLAYVIYGFTAFGASALGALEADGKTRNEALSAIGVYFDVFLKSHGY